MTKLILLIPDRATKVKSLKMLQVMQKPGIYYGCHKNGSLAFLGIAKKKEKLWVDNKLDGKICILQLLKINKDGQSGSIRGQVSIEMFNKNAEITSASSYRDDGDVSKTALVTFEEWATDIVKSLIKNSRK